jgi:GT2 family glycosyltransferase
VSPKSRLSKISHVQSACSIGVSNSETSGHHMNNILFEKEKSQSEKSLSQVSAVVLNWNGKNLLRQCLQSLQDQVYDLKEVIVVDNGSIDGSADMVKNEFPGAKLLCQQENLGAPKGRNVGIKESLKRVPAYIFTLDNDLYVDKSTISRLVKILDDNPDIGVVGAGIYYADRPDVIFSAGQWVNWTQNLVSTRGANQKDKGQFALLKDVDYVGTGAMLTRRSVFENVGLPDESYIGYGYEDTDFGIRVRKAGLRVVCYLPAKVWHRPHSGVGRYSFKKKYLESRNAIRFMRIYGTPSRWAKFTVYVTLGLVYAFFREGLRGNMGGVMGKARGLVDGIRDREELALELLKQER